MFYVQVVSEKIFAILSLFYPEIKQKSTFFSVMKGCTVAE